jgi:hypothetical protein
MLENLHPRTRARSSFDFEHRHSNNARVFQIRKDKRLLGTAFVVHRYTWDTRELLVELFCNTEEAEDILKTEIKDSLRHLHRRFVWWK